MSISTQKPWRWGTFALGGVLILAGCSGDAVPEGEAEAAAPVAEETTVEPTVETIAAQLASQPPQATSGAELVASVCSTCHPNEPPPTLAPPLNMVVGHYVQEHGDASAVQAAVVAWLAEPDPSRSSMPDHAIERFGLMPPIPLTEAQREAVATYLVDEFGDTAMGDHEGEMGEHGGMDGRMGSGNH